MNILIDIGHPAHVHYFRHLAWALIKANHNVIFTVKAKEVSVQLIKAYRFRYIVLGRNHSGTLSKVLSLISYTIRLFFVSIKFKPDILFNATPSAALVSRILGKYHVALEDTFNMEQVNLYLPFTSLVITGDYPHTFLGKKQLALPFYQELLYLHPKYFVPNKSVINELGVSENDHYAIVRFVSWSASHDIGHKGLLIKNKVKLVEQLSKYMQVFVSSEGELPSELRKYKIRIQPEMMHDALYYAHLFIGESATMASECAMMGTPAIFLNNTHFGSIDDQVKYGLIYTYSESEVDQSLAISKAVEMATQDNIKTDYAIRRDKMLQDKADVTAFLIWLVENYPESVTELRKAGFSFERFR